MKLDIPMSDLLIRVPYLVTYQRTIILYVPKLIYTSKITDFALLTYKDCPRKTRNFIYFIKLSL